MRGDAARLVCILWTGRGRGAVLGVEAGAAKDEEVTGRGGGKKPKLMSDSVGESPAYAVSDRGRLVTHGEGGSLREELAPNAKPGSAEGFPDMASELCGVLDPSTGEAIPGEATP
eukprot:SRR837773.24293.p4 GENE.SRR837773.24293~~SRR837773.24293.p4  ORF type:complete len:115 (+),score=16.23 SRR837773.24293:790-1134(+)